MPECVLPWASNPTLGRLRLFKGHRSRRLLQMWSPPSEPTAHGPRAKFCEVSVWEFDHGAIKSYWPSSRVCSAFYIHTSGGGMCRSGFNALRPSGNPCRSLGTTMRGRPSAGPRVWCPVVEQGSAGHCMSSSHISLQAAEQRVSPRFGTFHARFEGDCHRCSSCRNTFPRGGSVQGRYYYFTLVCLFCPSFYQQSPSSD